MPRLQRLQQTLRQCAGPTDVLDFEVSRSFGWLRVCLQPTQDEASLKTLLESPLVRAMLRSNKNRNIELKSFVNRKVSLLLRGDFEDQHFDAGKPIVSQVLRIIVSVEYDMKIGSASLFGRLCCGLSLAVLALSVSLDGSRTVRAEDADVLTSSMQELIVDPIMKTVQGLEARLTSVEATVGAMSESFTSRRVVAQMLCVSDDSGAQTCITKAQLDSLLSGIARAEISQPSGAVTDAKAQPTKEPLEIAVAEDPAPASEPAGVVEEKSVADQEPEHTGTVRSASSGAAVVLDPGVEVTEEPAPADADPAEPTTLTAN